MLDRTYCANYQECPIANLCERSSWPKGAPVLSMADFFEPFIGDEQNYKCEYFLCNCSRVKHLGSNRHGSYYKCTVCGEETES